MSYRPVSDKYPNMSDDNLIYLTISYCFVFDMYTGLYLPPVRLASTLSVFTHDLPFSAHTLTGFTCGLNLTLQFNDLSEEKDSI